MKILLVLMLSPLAILAQRASGVVTVFSAPSGNCPGNAPLQHLAPTNSLYGCVLPAITSLTGTWTIIIAGGGGTGTVTSVGFSATPGTVTGSPITTAGTINYSFTAANVVSLFSGCSGVLLLGADNACHPAGTGSVTSVGLAGTSNQITVTGTSPITTSGSWTLSIPTSPTLPGTTSGTFSGNLTGNVTGNVSGTSGSTTGNAATATALAANGTNCSAGTFPLGVDASGNAENCTALPTSITGTANQITASASTGAITLSIPTNPTLPGTTSGTFSGNLTGNVTGNTSGTSGSTTGNAATATALAANGTNCSANSAAGGVDASGNAEACTAYVLNTRNINTTSPLGGGGALSADLTVTCTTCLVHASVPFMGNSNGSTITTGATRYLTTSAVISNEVSGQFIVPFSGTLTTFYMVTASTQGAANLVCTLRIASGGTGAGTNTAIAITIVSGDTARRYNATGSVSINAGDALSAGCVMGAATSAQLTGWGIGIVI